MKGKAEKVGSNFSLRRHEVKKRQNHRKEKIKENKRGKKDKKMEFAICC
jgi:hypothetical protein